MCNYISSRMRLRKRRKNKRIEKRNSSARYLKKKNIMTTPVDPTWVRRLFSLLSVTVKGEQQRFKSLNGKNASFSILDMEDKDYRALDLENYEANQFGYFNCPAVKCMERFFDKDKLEFHIIINHSTQGRKNQFKCVEHRKMLRGIPEFNKHFRTHHSNGCASCSDEHRCASRKDLNVLD